MFKFKKLMACATLCAICLMTIIPARASASTYTATPVYAVALGCPYHFTLSVQNNNTLVMSGNAPDYYGAGVSVKLDLIKPVNYTDFSIGSDGIATVEKNTDIDLDSPYTRLKLKPTIMGSLTHNLTLSSAVAPIITATDTDGKSVLTYDLPNVPKLSLAGVSDGIYNIRLSFSINPSYGYLYCDEILIVVQSGKAAIQVLPTYVRYTDIGDATGIYTGYSLYKWDVRPAITIADEEKWLLSQ
ncbi:hypothetical protein [Clostridium chromiireducens]|uniref:Uncharacterized protein n=1 Tax=Clostridium chromiireducens TaxID=225345 RepID=A0A1V4J0G9_9CLOT|nr:hypothetical protein [Clostridium chromiireducens]OPJ65504.1 hypothetical protein CLCHR_06960 [Clostridium chromiireducens]